MHVLPESIMHKTKTKCNSAFQIFTFYLYMTKKGKMKEM